jgi:phenylpropionate dioxygenase-like ring-hydroxylating dioxygenase large terminal subunit
MVAVTVSPATGQLLDDSALIRRIFDHLDNGTTDLAPETWSEPVANYRSPARLDAEIDLVLRRQPTPFCPSAALPAAGSYLARSAAGVPVVAVRGSDGRVRAFRNACRHRGTTVASGQGCSKALVCPYHGWVYGLDGSLRQVPDGYGFPGLDKADRGLVAVRAEERGGLVFVTQDEQDAGEGDSPVGWLPPDLIAADQQLLSAADAEIDVNWKVFAEGFLEGYHLKATHRETFLPYGYDNVTVVEAFGRHSRVTFPFRRIEALRDRPPGSWRLDGMATLVHHVFPNTMVVHLSQHTLMVVLEPLAVDRTRLVTYQLTSRSSGPEAGESARRDASFVSLGAAEDLAVAQAVQAGLASGANDVLTFGRFEGAIGHFHRQLDSLVEGAEGAERAAP